MNLAIVCGSPSSEMLAPFDDKKYDIWVLGNRSDRYPRYDLIFEIHDDLEQHDENYAQWLVDKKIPMIVGTDFPLEADHIEVFPYEESEKLFGSLYLTSSSAMMLCLAILRDYDVIEIYGVDMAVDDFEYFWQRPCMEAWIGFARGRGHEVILHKLSPVCKAEYVEGMESGGRPDFSKPPFTEAEFLSLAKRHQDKITEFNSKILTLQAALQSQDGARQAYTHMARVARAIEAGNDIKTLGVTIALKDEVRFANKALL